MAPPLSFAIVREEGRLTWLGFPVQQASTAQVVFERFQEMHRGMGLKSDLEFVAGGSMAEAAIVFTESQVERDDIYGMVAGVFGAPQEPYYHLSRYENAVVTTALETNGGLTVVQILALYELEPCWVH